MASVAPTRRRSPDHPPYALMIGAAINSLAEEGGSSEESISRYIQSNYGGIPPAHDLLLPYYLAKLTANAEFAISTPGRYVVPQHADAEEVGTDIEEGLPLACDGDVVMTAQALPVKRRRGRLPKEKTTMCAAADGSDDDTPARKRRGRPPKRKMEPPIGEFSDDRTGKSEPESVARIAEKTRKRCGRPPKSAKKPDEDTLVVVMTTPETPVSDESKSVGAAAEKSGKRRGRPPKYAKKTAERLIEKTDKDGPKTVAVTVEKTGKRRGRPPKRKRECHGL